jgi:hypothetical protein
MRAKNRMASDPGSSAPAPAAPQEGPAPATSPRGAASPQAAASGLFRLEEAAPQPTGRRPYQPPRILFREPLEAMAAICSPHPPAKNNKGVCPMGPISS